MTFPTIPTVGAGRVVGLNQLNTTATLTGPNLNTLTKAPGDLLIAIAGEYQSDAGADAAFTGWAGGGLTWTEIRDSTGTAVNRLGVAFARVVTGSETGTVTVTRSGTLVGDASMIVLCIPGVHATTNPEATVMVTGTTAAADPAALNPAGWDIEDTLWIGVNGNGMTNATSTWTANASAPANYTDYFDTNAADTSTIGDFELAVAFWQLRAASEDMGGFGQDLSNARNSALLIAVRPAIPNPPIAGVATGDFGFTGDALGVVSGATLGVATGIFGFTAVALGTSAPTVTRSVVASSDDAVEAPAASPSLAEPAPLADAVGTHFGFRFTDLPMQNSAVIISAVPSFTLTDSDKNDAEGTWYAHDTDDATTVTPTNGDIDGRTKTTASVAWTTNDLGTVGNRINGPNLAAVIQEVVDRAGWRPGNNIALLYAHNSATDKLILATWDHTTEPAPSLLVRYRLIPTVTGLVVHQFGFTAIALGTVSGGATTGIATGIFGFVGTALGVPETFGTATGNFGFTATALGIDRQTGTATGLFGFTGTASGRPRKVGTALGSFGFTGTALGIPRPRGLATGPFGFTGTAIGSTAGTKVGSATGLFGFTGVALGVPETFGTATGLFGFVGTGLGKPFVTGTATGLLVFTATANGRPRIVGVAVAPFGFVGTATVIGPVVVPGIPVAVRDCSHAVAVTDPAKVVFVTDLPTALAITTNGQHSAAVSDTAKTITVQDNDHTLMVSTPD
jgi:hypothetical protein